MIVAAEMLDVWGAARGAPVGKAGWRVAVWGRAERVPSMPARFQCWLWRLVMLKFASRRCGSVPIELPLLPAAESAAGSVASEQARRELNRRRRRSFPLHRPPSAGPLPPLSILFAVWIAVVGWQSDTPGERLQKRAGSSAIAARARTSNCSIT